MDDCKRYLRHDIRLTEERKTELFRQAKSYLSIYEVSPEVIDQSENIRYIRPN